MTYPLPASAQSEKFVMARSKLNYSQFGIDGDADKIIDRFADLFNERFKGGISIDELLLHPREAGLFCDFVRGAEGYVGLPDDMILRPLMTRRKAAND